VNLDKADAVDDSVKLTSSVVDTKDMLKDISGPTFIFFKTFVVFGDAKYLC